MQKTQPQQIKTLADKIVDIATSDSTDKIGEIIKIIESAVDRTDRLSIVAGIPKAINQGKFAKEDETKLNELQSKIIAELQPELQHALDPYFSDAKKIIESGSVDKVGEIRKLIEENKPNANNKVEQKYYNDFVISGVLKGIENADTKHLTGKEKDELKELKIGLEKELQDQYFSRLENELNNPNTEDKKALILRAIVKNISSENPQTNDTNQYLFDLMKKDPKVLDDFKKLCNEFKDRPVAEIAERLPESNLFMRICHYIQNLFQNTLRGKVKETKKSFVKALENEKLKPRQSQAFNNTL